MNTAVLSSTNPSLYRKRSSRDRILVFYPTMKFMLTPTLCSVLLLVINAPVLLASPNFSPFLPPAWPLAVRNPYLSGKPLCDTVQTPTQAP